MPRINDPERNPPPAPGTSVLCHIPDRLTYSSQEDRGDFNDNADALWSLYVEKAQNHDEAKFQTLTKNMTDVLLFVRSHAPTLTVCVQL